MSMTRNQTNGRIFCQIVKLYAYIYPLSRCRECMRGMVCVAGGEGCGDTGPSRVQEG